MPISQPSYPTRTDDLVDHVGDYVDTHEADTSSVHGLSSTTACKGVAIHNGTSYPSRPTGFGSIEWIGPTEPSGAQDGDTWVPTA